MKLKEKWIIKCKHYEIKQIKIKIIKNFSVSIQDRLDNSHFAKNPPITQRNKKTQKIRYENILKLINCLNPLGILLSFLVLMTKKNLVRFFS